MVNIKTKQDLIDELRKCSTDPIYFISNYIKVVHPVRGLVPFELYPFQHKIVNALQGNRFNILKKFRQAGCTTIAAAYSLWLTIFSPHQKVVILSIGDVESTEVLDRIKIMYTELPEWLKKVAKVTSINKHNLVLNNGSHINSRPSSRESARGLSCSLLIIDEAAFIDRIQTIWAAAYPTISSGGRAFVLSTVNGIGNWYYHLWKDAENQRNSFNPIDIKWQEHPEYHRNPGYEDLYEEMLKRNPPLNIDDWEKMTRSNIGQKKWLQEFEGAFLGTGDTFIDGTILTFLNQGIDSNYYQRYQNRLFIWNDPEPDNDYVIGVDVALGRERDYSAFHVLNLRTGEIVAEFYSNRTRINEFADILTETGYRYNTASIVCERNSVGQALIDILFLRKEYENMWMDDKGNIGKIITSANRDQLLTEMEEAIRTQRVKIKSKRLVEELNTFVISPTGKYTAEIGKNDDLVMSLALTTHGAKEYFKSNPIVPNTFEDREVAPLSPLHNYRLINSAGQGVSEDISWLTN